MIDTVPYTQMYFEADLSSMEVEYKRGSLLDGIFKSTDDNKLYLSCQRIYRNIYRKDRHTLKPILGRHFTYNCLDMSKNSFSFALRRISSNGIVRWTGVWAEISKEPFTDRLKAFVMVKDIHEEKLSQLKVLKHSRTDIATSLYNKATTERLISNALKSISQNGCALLLIDVDNLKSINDTYGHTQGDKAITFFAAALKNCFGDSAIIGRIGGDEFMVFLPYIESDAQAENIVSFLSQKLSQLRTAENSNFCVKGSIGAVISHDNSCTFEALYEKADKALYHVKANNKGGYAFYNSLFFC